MVPLDKIQGSQNDLWISAGCAVELEKAGGIVGEVWEGGRGGWLMGFACGVS